MIRQHELDPPEARALPPAKPDQEDDRSGRRSEARRFRVEAQQRDVLAGMAGESGEARSIERQVLDGGLDPDERSCPAMNHLPAERRGDPFGEASWSR